MMDKKERIILFTGAFFLLAVIVLFVISVKYGLHNGLAERIRGFGFFAPAAFFLVQLAESVIPFFPGFLLTAAAGFLFGPLVGTFIAVMAVLAGSTMVFFASRRFEKSIFHSLPQKELRHFEKFMEKKGSLAVLIARFVPIFPSCIVSFSAGLTEMSYPKFLLFSLLGMLPQQLALAFFGSSLQQGFNYLSALLAMVFFLTVLIFSFRHRIKKAIIKEISYVEKEIKELQKKC